MSEWFLAAQDDFIEAALRSFEHLPDGLLLEDLRLDVTVTAGIRTGGASAERVTVAQELVLKAALGVKRSGCAQPDGLAHDQAVGRPNGCSAGRSG